MKYFFVGIKGVGMTSIATLYKEWGHDVSGSDTEEEFFTDKILRELGVTVLPFAAENITRDLDTVFFSSAYNGEHTEIKRAKELGLRLISYGEALAEIFNVRKGILVTGTHGKTTSAAMLGLVLEDAGFDPTVVVGGELVEWQRTARASLGGGTSKSWMVAEGDEYQAKILMLKPQLLLITNIEYDHPDFYANEEAYRDVFRKLLEQMSPDSLVVVHETLCEFISTI